MIGIHYNENLALWEFDNWATLDRFQELQDKHPLIKAWQREAVDYITDFTGKVLQPAPFSPTLAKLKKGDYRSTIYLHTLAKVYPGKEDEYMDAVGKGAQAYGAKVGHEAGWLLQGGGWDCFQRRGHQYLDGGQYTRRLG
jgi:hypothetical protein